ncbi:CPBP family intramembrane glutamic endopeptidase [Brevibacterium atlanticum]|uniref:CPBP family intramembrane glutamic endopeptidase n=1 Tax=Brevibacterium atlanticum TaxID=2697563 RepID=UPI00141EB741|nr:type II CAAX endopeptidase family protein [Brevibacterium atlanticum]
MNVSLSSPQPHLTRGHSAPSRPGWPEMIIGLIAYVVAFGAVYLILKAIPDDLAVINGIVQLGLSGLMGLFAFAVAVAIRIRGFSAFGLKRASRRSLIIAALLGIGCWVLGTIVSLISYAINGGIGNVQGDYQAAAAAGGVFTVILTALMGAVLTPIGEEFFFRGVLTSGLLRFGPWVGVLVSAAIFALAHGINPVLPVAFIVGIVNGILFHKTGSVWSGVIVHAFNNATALFVPVILGLSG